MNNNPSLFELRHVSKSYRLGEISVEVLKNINLKFYEAELLALAGPSGSGKTTLLNILGCLDVPTAGEVVIDGQTVDQKSEKRKMLIRRDKIGFIFQDFNLIPVINVYENVEYPLFLSKVPGQKRKELVEKALVEVGLKNRMKYFPNALSGGERQRVSIARALVKRPKLILADEPTANLDSETAFNIINLLRELNEKDKITMLFSTHDVRILSVAKKVYQIKDGKI